MYSLTVLEARSLKLRCWQNCVPFRGSKGRLCPFLLPASGGPASLLSWWLHSSRLCSHAHIAYLQGLPLPLSYKRLEKMPLGPTWIIQDKLLCQGPSLNHSCTPFFFPPITNTKTLVIVGLLIFY